MSCGHTCNLHVLHVSYMTHTFVFFSVAPLSRHVPTSGTESHLSTLNYRRMTGWKMSYMTQSKPQPFPHENLVLIHKFRAVTTFRGLLRQLIFEPASVTVKWVF